MFEVAFFSLLMLLKILLRFSTNQGVNYLICTNFILKHNYLIKLLRAHHREK